jgi:hypothetical protein
MMPAEDTRRLIAELETALRLDRPAGVRVARAVAAAEDAERRSGGGGFAPRPAAKADAAARQIFWRLVAEIRRAAAARTSHDGMIAAIVQAIEDARDDLSEGPDASR